MINNIRKIQCLCGFEVTANTYKSHVISKRCNLDSQCKSWLINILNIKTKFNRAWLISEGQNALAKIDWHYSVINKETSLNSWRFDTPRNLGQMRDSVKIEMAAARTGINNPMVKSKNFSFSKKQIIDWAKAEWPEYLKTATSALNFYKVLNNKFPDFAYIFADVEIPQVRTSGNVNLLLFILNITIDDWAQTCLKVRGQQISKGQKASQNFKEISSRNASKNLHSANRTTGPQLILFEMINSIDPDASLEFHIKSNMEEGFNGKSFSFDIFSPKNNLLIEMHGAVFHKITKKTNNNMIKIVQSNLINDKNKEQIAKLRGYNLYKFWDDSVHTWEKEIGAIYGQKPSIKFKEAYDKICKKLGKRIRLRYKRP